MRRRAHMHAPRRARAFTLIEVVVAVGILALMGGLVFGTFSRAMVARDRAEELTDHYHQIRQAMARMAREISSAFISTHRDCEELRAETLFRSQRRSTGMRLDFTSFAHFRTQVDVNESDQQEIGYFVERRPDDAARTVLFRRHQARIDDEADDGGEEEILAEDVTQLDFEFYDPKDDDWKDEWDSQSGEARERLPMFVAIHLKAKNPAGQQEEFVTKTRVFLPRALRIVGIGARQCIE